MEKKQLIIRKDGVTYQRKCKDDLYNERVCVRISKDMYDKLKQKGKVGTVIREIIIDYLDKE